MTVTDIKDLSAGQWAVLVSNLAFFVTVWFARGRRQYIRAFAFSVAPGVAVMYHLQEDTDVLGSDSAISRANSIIALYLSASTALLFAHFPRQWAELLVEAVLIPAAYGWSYVDTRAAWMYGFLPATVIVVIVSITWGVWGRVPARMPWLIAGVITAILATTAFFISNASPSMLWLHASWHILAAATASMLIYGLRDPELLSEYAALDDLTARTST